MGDAGKRGSNQEDHRKRRGNHMPRKSGHYTSGHWLPIHRVHIPFVSAFDHHSARPLTPSSNTRVSQSILMKGLTSSRSAGSANRSIDIDADN
jgi:hypothetical protein